MTRLVSWLISCGISATIIGCASTTWNGYQAGTVKFSQIDYNYTAQPVLKDPANKTYQIDIDASVGNINSIPDLEKRGVRKVTSGADVVFIITSGEITHEPGGFGFGAPYKPAVFATMPIKIQVNDNAGRTVLERQLKHEEILTVNGAKEYNTREEAKAAMTVIDQFTRSSADAKVRSEAPTTIRKNLNLLSKDLFEPRKVSVILPALRSSGNVDMEAAYTLLANAKSDDQVKAALAAYVTLGVEHKKPDSTDDFLGNYGVLCGLASAKILAGDLAGAWDDTRRAWKAFPEGKEYKMIAKVLKQQEEQTGISIVGQDDYNEMIKDNSGVNNTASEMMKDLFKK